MTVNFFSFTPEIRLMIYSELLVLSEPIIFVADYGPYAAQKSKKGFVRSLNSITNNYIL